MRIKIDLTNEIKFFNKIKKFIDKILEKSNIKKYYLEYKTKREKENRIKEYKKWFEDNFGVKSKDVKHNMHFTHKSLFKNSDLSGSAKLYNESRKSPNFVDFDVIDIHNEYCHQNTETWKDILDVEKDKETFNKKTIELLNDSKPQNKPKEDSFITALKKASTKAILNEYNEKVNNSNLPEAIKKVMIDKNKLKD